MINPQNIGPRRCRLEMAGWEPWSSVGLNQEHIQFNEETLWTGAPNDYAHKGASQTLNEIRQLLFDNKQEEATPWP